MIKWNVQLPKRRRPSARLHSFVCRRSRLNIKHALKSKSKVSLSNETLNSKVSHIFSPKTSEPFRPAKCLRPLAFHNCHLTSLRLTCSKIMDVIMFLLQNRQTFCFTTLNTLFHLSLPSLLTTATLQPHGLNFLVESGYSFLHYGHEVKSVWRKANSLSLSEPCVPQ